MGMSVEYWSPAVWRVWIYLIQR